MVLKLEDLNKPEVWGGILENTRKSSAFAAAARKIEIPIFGVRKLNVELGTPSIVEEGAEKPVSEPTLTALNIHTVKLAYRFSMTEEVSKEIELTNVIKKDAPNNFAKTYDDYVSGAREIPAGETNFDTLDGVQSSVVTDYASLVEAFGKVKNGRVSDIIVSTAFETYLRTLVKANGEPWFPYEARTLDGNASILGHRLRVFESDELVGFTGDFANKAVTGAIPGQDSEGKLIRVNPYGEGWKNNVLEYIVESRHAFRTLDESSFVKLTAS